MIGNATHTIDSKSRLFLPVKMREELGDSVYLVKGLDNCISVMSVEKWRSYELKLKSQSDSRARAIQRVICSSAARCDVDAQGRIVLPQKLREYAGLENDATIVGVIDHAELWNPGRWSGYENEFTADDLADAMELFDV